MRIALRLLACVFVLAVCALPACASENPLPAFLTDAATVAATPSCSDGDSNELLDDLLLRGPVGSRRAPSPDLACNNFCCTSNTQCTIRCGDAAACVGTGSCKRCIFL